MKNITTIDHIFREVKSEPKVMTVFDKILPQDMDSVYNGLSNQLLKLAQDRFITRNPGKTFDKTNLKGLAAIRNWIFGYKKTENGYEKVDREKGLWLYGDVGTGKTFAMQVFVDFLHSIYYDGTAYKSSQYVLFKTTTPLENKTKYTLPYTPIVQARVIRQQYNSVLNNEEVEIFHDDVLNSARISNYKSGGNASFKPLMVKTENELMKYYTNCPLFIIDDLGAENGILNHYGTQINVIEEILSSRYDKNKLTFVTTNIVNPKDVYDKRICSRMNEMFTSVLIDGKDMRENQ